jgi:hypothetical protein
MRSAMAQSRKQPAKPRRVAACGHPLPPLPNSHVAGARLLRRLCAPLPAGTRIWRYMDFAKFVSFLERRALFFAQLSTLSDPFEGAFAKANLTRRGIMQPGAANERYLRDPVFSRNRTVVVNCWHLGHHESVALWRQYASANASVCVQSTYRRLRQSIPDVDIGRLRYIDYGLQPVPETHMALPLLHKRVAFSHERELRAFMFLSTRFYDGVEEAVGGYWRDVDLDVLIQRIYVAPQSPAWIADLVHSLAGRYGLKAPVVQSSLDDSPLGATEIPKTPQSQSQSQTHRRHRR